MGRPPDGERSRTCPQCLGAFTYQIARGTDRIYCAPACTRAATRARCAQRTLPACAVDGCATPRRSPGAAYCELHYYRLRRTGTTAPRTRAERRIDSRGYVTLHAPDHPLADSTGYVYEHRAARLPHRARPH